MLKNSSEIQEAVALFEKLVPSAKPAPKPSREERGFALKGKVPLRFETPPPRPAPLTREEVDGEYTDDKLGNVLMRMCQRGQFTYGVLIDADGFFLGKYGSQYEDEKISALAALLGSAQEKLRSLLESSSEGVLSFDLNLLDKLVFCPFDLGGTQFFILIVCPQDRDVHEELELTISEIKAVLNP